MINVTEDVKYFCSYASLSHERTHTHGVRNRATGCFQFSVADCTDVAQPSVCKYLRLVAKTIADLAPEVITSPAPEHEQQTMNQFFSIERMLGVTRCINGVVPL